MMLALAFSFHTIIAQLQSVLAILGGRDVSISQAPYHVNYGDICGGALIHKRWAITTAHCGQYRIRGPKVQIILHLVHPQYGIEHMYDYDIQLLKLKRNLLFGKTVSAINMCDGNCGGDILVSGWGYPIERGDYKDVLQQVQLKIVSFSKCQRVKEFWYNYTLTSRMFCAGGAGGDACQGDSGGGAVSRDGLVGLSSFGIGCGRVPGVYINTSHPDIRNWIRGYTGV